MFFVLVKKLMSDSLYIGITLLRSFYYVYPLEKHYFDEYSKFISDKPYRVRMLVVISPSLICGISCIISIRTKLRR